MQRASPPQVVVSSYFNTVVRVVPVCSVPRGGAQSNVYDREVQLWVDWDNGRSQQFAVCRSTVVVSDPVLQGDVQQGTIGIGQIFEHIRQKPKFQFQAAGRGRTDLEVGHRVGRSVRFLAPTPGMH